MVILSTAVGVGLGWSAVRELMLDVQCCLVNCVIKGDKCFEVLSAVVSFFEGK